MYSVSATSPLRVANRHIHATARQWRIAQTLAAIATTPKGSSGEWGETISVTRWQDALYLFPDREPAGHMANYKVRGQLTRELRGGARIVSYWRDLGDWTPTALKPVPAIWSYPASAVKL